MVTQEQCLQINIVIATDKGGYRIVNADIGAVNGENNLKGILAAAAKENSFQRQAAHVGLGIRHDQPFCDGNTRTGVAALYFVCIDAGFYIKRKPYHVYAWLDRWVREYATDTEEAIAAVAGLIIAASFELDSKQNAKDVFNRVLQETTQLSSKLEIFGQMSQFLGGKLSIEGPHPEYGSLSETRAKYKKEFSPQERHIYQQFLKAGSSV